MARALKRVHVTITFDCTIGRVAAADLGFLDLPTEDADEVAARRELMEALSGPAGAFESAVDEKSDESYEWLRDAGIDGLDSAAFCSKCNYDGVPNDAAFCPGCGDELVP